MVQAVNSETIHQVRLRCPTAFLRPLQGDRYIVSRKTVVMDAVGLPCSSMDEAWDSALMLLRERDVRAANVMAYHHAGDAITEHKQGIEAKRTTLDDRALKLKESIQAALTEFMQGYVAVDLPGLEG